MITVLCGGVGAAKFLRGLVQVVPPEDVVAVVNTGDDFDLHGLRICPDIDTIRYTLSNDVGEQGWGRADETWNAMAALGQYASAAPERSRADDWFSLGDRDLGTHLYRTQRMAEGASLSTVTGELARAAGVAVTMLPMTNDPVPTMVRLATGEVIDFQEYFVARRHDVAVNAVEFRGAAKAHVPALVLDAIAEAETVIISPSNPMVSIGPMLAMPRLREAVRRRREDVVAVSPVVGGAAIKGPTTRLMSELGFQPSVVGVAQLWAPLASRLVIDEADRGQSAGVFEAGLTPVVTDTVMIDAEAAASLAKVALQA